jgi:hypothetical protein
VAAALAAGVRRLTHIYGQRRGVARHAAHGALL